MYRSEHRLLCLIRTAFLQNLQATAEVSTPDSYKDPLSLFIIHYSILTVYADAPYTKFMTMLLTKP